MKRSIKQKLAVLLSIVLIGSSMGTIAFADGEDSLSRNTTKLAASSSEADVTENEDMNEPEKTENDKKQESNTEEAEQDQATEKEEQNAEDKEEAKGEESLGKETEEDQEIPEPEKQIMFLNAEFEEEEVEEASPSEAEFIAPNKPAWMIGKNALGGKERPGWGMWTDDLTEDEKEQVQTTIIEMYRDGELLTGGNMDEYTTKADMRFWFEKPGEYYFRCVYPMTDDWDAGEDDWSDFSEPYVYKKIGKPAPVPSGLKWDKDGGTTWDDVLDDAADYVADMDEYEWGGCYRVKIYKKNADGTYDFEEPFDQFKTGRTQNKSRFGWDIYDDPNGTYVFTVATIGDLVHYDYSAESLPSAEFYVGDALHEAQGTLESLLNEGNIKDAVENASMSQEERDVMRLAVQTDKITESKLKELEEKYRAAAGKDALVVTSGSPLVDGSKVSVTGGILNGAEAITFQPAEINDEDLPYKKVIGLEISLEGDGVGGDLAFPVLLTMPVPKGISANKLVIVHYKNDGSKEYIYPRINQNGTMSFAVTSFSEFAFVDTSDETVKEPDNNNSSSSSGSHSSSRGGGGGGGSSKSTASAGTSGTWIQDQYGWWFEKVGGSYPVSDWLMTTDGNWFRFDEKGYMMTGWFIDLAGNRFYLNPISDGTKGAMKTGWQTIDGKIYYFNPVSDGTKGAMKVGWQMIDGSWYYFNMLLDENYGMLLINAVTPDGYSVGADGKRIIN